MPAPTPAVDGEPVIPRPLFANAFDPWFYEPVDDLDGGTVSPIRASNHVVIRPVMPPDFDWVYQAATMTSAGSHWRLHGSIPTIEQFKQLLDGNTTSTYIMCAREAGADGRPGQPFGMVQTFLLSHADRHAQITAFIHPAFQKRAWPLEGIILYLDYIFTVYSLRKIYFETTEYEIGQFGSALNKIMVEEGCLKGHRRLYDKYADVYYMALYRDALIDIAKRILPKGTQLTRPDTIDR